MQVLHDKDNVKQYSLGCSTNFPILKVVPAPPSASVLWEVGKGFPEGG